jgi:hypothetical protein
VSRNSTTTPPRHATPRPDRAATTQLLDDFLQQQQRDGTSARRFAGQHDLPPSTLLYRLQRRQRSHDDPHTRDFFESPSGLAFLHQLLVALHLVFTQQGCAGLRLLCLFLRLCGLDRFLASSFGSQQQLGVRLEQAILLFGQQQRQRLAAGMTPKTISVCQDETFHPDCCLVALEAISGFLLLERYAAGRDEATWNDAMRPALQDLPVTIRLAASDEAKGLLAHARHGLGVPHAPDLFHFQHELCKVLAAPLARQTRAAESALEQARNDLTAWQQKQGQAQRLPRPGRPKDYSFWVGWAESRQQQAAVQVQQCQQRQEDLRETLAELSAAYHPYDLSTAAAVQPEQLQERLTKSLDRLEQVADEAGLAEKAQPALAKTRRLVPGLVAALAYFWTQVQEVASGLPEAVGPLWLGSLLAGAYLQQAGRKLREASQRASVGSLGKAVLGVVKPEGVALWQWEKWQALAWECAGWFVRGSSAVEGRNGVLELRHRHLHRLSERKLGVLTTLHNYWIKRPDGTTAAQRFFGQAPADLFGHLVTTLPMPARPAKRRQKAA